MPKQKTQGPTQRELDVLKVLWQRGDSSLKDIQTAINKRRKRPLAYTTIQTVVITMVTKGEATRRFVQGDPVIHARVTEDATRQLTIRRIADDLFGGSVAALIGHALATQRMPPKELSELKARLGGR